MTGTQQDWQDFVARWAKSGLKEQQAAQSHFNELCHLLGEKTPTEADPEGKFFTFEEHLQKATGGNGRADVWHRGRFGWEYKGKQKDLDAAYAQLLAYRGALENPPLLVVCDFLEYRIYPQWTNLSGKPYIFRNEDLLTPEKRVWLLWVLTDPDKFRELLDEELHKRSELTEEKAAVFADLADKMRRAQDDNGNTLWTPMQVARFLTKVVFAMFAEDIELLPRIGEQKVFEYILERSKDDAEAFVPTMRELFEAMNGAKSYFAGGKVAYFNGGLFRDSAEGANDGVEVLDIMHKALRMHDMRKKFADLAAADWRKVNPTIFGTLFERALDPGKRAQLGAHYTSESDIRLIVEPVLMEPLYRQWDEVRQKAEPLLQVVVNAESAPRAVEQAEAQLTPLYAEMMQALGGIKVLDPACGSGNFLYVSLRALKDLEDKIRTTFAPVMAYVDVITPRQLYGIEKDAFAAKLAQIVVWIGYLQWRYEHAGRLRTVNRGEKADKPELLEVPILKDKDAPNEPPRILNDDAILRYGANGKPYEPEWPKVDVIVGNPPFLGDKKMRSELGDVYSETVRSLYSGRVPGGADFVTYWFEKARHAIDKTNARRVGLLATNSIRGGINRTVLDRIKETGDIFFAWSDRQWILDGAAVRISLIGFDNRTEQFKQLDGKRTLTINADLTSTVDITQAKTLQQNAKIGFIGDSKKGRFDISEDIARQILASSNPSERSNRDVVLPWINSSDITDRIRNVWIIDFGIKMTETEAQFYIKPYEYVLKHVKPIRDKVRNTAERQKWWLHARPVPEMRKAISKLDRFLVTPTLSKHRLFVWLEGNTIPDHQLYVLARSDDYFFGVVHSYLHEYWSLLKGTSLGATPRYTPRTTFETYPFPYTPGKEPVGEPIHARISAAAAQLHAERNAWLNPAHLEGGEKALKERTLTNLYNAVEEYRRRDVSQAWQSRESAAKQFAPRLAALHAEVDSAVLASYGWSDLDGRLRTDEGDEELLRRLLALNLERAGV